MRRSTRTAAAVPQYRVRRAPRHRAVGEQAPRPQCSPRADRIPLAPVTPERTATSAARPACIGLSCVPKEAHRPVAVAAAMTRAVAASFAEQLRTTGGGTERPGTAAECTPFWEYRPGWCKEVHHSQRDRRCLRISHDAVLDIERIGYWQPSRGSEPTTRYPGHRAVAGRRAGRNVPSNRPKRRPTVLAWRLQIGPDPHTDYRWAFANYLILQDTWVGAAARGSGSSTGVSKSTMSSRYDSRAT